MAAILDKVQDYVIEARRLLQDQDQPYRYQDSDIVSALNLGISEIARLRWDIIADAFPSGITLFSTTSLTMSVPIDIRYRLALIYYVVGNVQLRDDEQTQDQRAQMFINSFANHLAGAI